MRVSGIRLLSWLACRSLAFAVLASVAMGRCLAGVVGHRAQHPGGGDVRFALGPRPRTADRAVRRVGSTTTACRRRPPAAVLMEGLGREIARLSRRLASSAALSERHRRADTLILERLPDPVIVLARDRAVRRANAAARSAFGDDVPAVLRHPGVRGAIDRALSTSQTQTAEVGLRGAGHSRPVCHRGADGPAAGGWRRGPDGAVGPDAGTRGGADASRFRRQRQP